MFTSLELFSIESSERNEENNYGYVRLLRTNLRTNTNILELPSPIFLKTFRLTKETFVYVLGLLDLPSGTRSTHIPPILQLAATLNLLGGGGYQRQVGADWTAPMGQSTVAVITGKVIKKMQSVLCPMMIKFEPMESTKEYFYEKYKIPGVIGCIDGSHVMILRPTENENMFFNRKGRHSLNAMFICDENSKIMAVNAVFDGGPFEFKTLTNCSHCCFWVTRPLIEEAVKERARSGCFFMNSESKLICSLLGLDLNKTWTIF